MFIQAKDNDKTLVVGADIYQAKAPGIFEVPDRVGRILSAFSHFDVVTRPLSDVLPKGQIGFKAKKEQPVAPVAKATRKRTSRKKA
jgi:hypothetical protein